MEDGNEGTGLGDKQGQDLLLHNLRGSNHIVFWVNVPLCGALGRARPPMALYAFLWSLRLPRRPWRTNESFQAKDSMTSDFYLKNFTRAAMQKLNLIERKTLDGVIRYTTNNMVRQESKGAYPRQKWWEWREAGRDVWSVYLQDWVNATGGDGQHRGY